MGDHHEAETNIVYLSEAREHIIIARAKAERRENDARRRLQRQRRSAEDRAKIEQYIADTYIPEAVAFKYELETPEALALYEHPDAWEVIRIAFNYGRAKGYKAREELERR